MPVAPTQRACVNLINDESNAALVGMRRRERISFTGPGSAAAHIRPENGTVSRLHILAKVIGRSSLSNDDGRAL